MIPDDAKDQIHGLVTEWMKIALEEHSRTCWNLLSATFVKRAGLFSALIAILLVSSDSIAFKIGMDIKGDVATILVLTNQHEKKIADLQDSIKSIRESERNRDSLILVSIELQSKQAEKSDKILRILMSRGMR